MKFKLLLFFYFIIFINPICYGSKDNNRKIDTSAFTQLSFDAFFKKEQIEFEKLLTIPDAIKLEDTDNEFEKIFIIKKEAFDQIRNLRSFQDINYDTSDPLYKLQEYLNEKDEPLNEFYTELFRRVGEKIFLKAFIANQNYEYKQKTGEYILMNWIGHPKIPFVGLAKGLDFKPNYYPEILKNIQVKILHTINNYRDATLKVYFLESTNILNKNENLHKFLEDKNAENFEFRISEQDNLGIYPLIIDAKNINKIIEDISIQVFLQNLFLYKDKESNIKTDIQDLINHGEFSNKSGFGYLLQSVIKEKVQGYVDIEGIFILPEYKRILLLFKDRDVKNDTLDLLKNIEFSSIRIKGDEKKEFALLQEVNYELYLNDYTKNISTQFLKDSIIIGIESLLNYQDFLQVLVKINNNIPNPLKTQEWSLSYFYQSFFLRKPKIGKPSQEDIQNMEDNQMTKDDLKNIIVSNPRYITYRIL